MSTGSGFLEKEYEMAKVLVVNHVTLDGVMQAPARADEDARDGFAHGGWATAHNDQAMAAKIGARMTGQLAFLFGRRTYEDFYDVWPKRPDDPMSQALTNTTKYVASRTLAEPLPWENSILLDGDAAAAVATLKERATGTLAIFGSGELIASLIVADLIDEYLLMIHPLVLGTGRRLFAEGYQAELALVDGATTSTGVLLATYQTSGGVQ
jgi:dihydrofolate reductase